MPSKTIIISASTADYFPLLEGLLLSIESDVRREGIDVGVLDLGLDEIQRQSLQQRGVIIMAPPWDYDLSHFSEPPPLYFKSMTARPHLRRHFPGYETYFWLDADCWVQDWDVAGLYLAAAKAAGFACTPECDRGYTPFYGQISALDFALRCFRMCVEESLAQSLTHFPLINSGAFAGRFDAPQWDKWSVLLGQAVRKLPAADFYIEQTALNVVIRTAGDSTALLPARCNWMCNRATPMSTPDGSLLVEPQFPHQALGIIHLTANTKHGTWGIADTTGGSRQRSLRFGGGGA